MCNTKPCDNCCHEEDLICCMPMMHCCGGYSEHNNCCPHNRCCNSCCGGCGCNDGCPFTPECCCCKAMKCCKENKKKIEEIEGDINNINGEIIRLEEKHDSDISGIGQDIAELAQNELDDINELWANAIVNVAYNSDTKYITYKTRNGSPINVVKVAPLDNANKIPSEYLPSYVDDVIEGYYYNNNFYYDQNHTNPITGEDGKIYVDITEGGNNTYRYTGSTYIEVSPTKFGKTAGTAYEGNNGKALEDNLAFLTGNVLNHFNNTDIHVTALKLAAWNAKYNKPSGGIPKSDLAPDVRESLSKADNALLAHQNIKSLDTSVSSGPLTPLASESIVGTGTILLHKISKTGAWGDLLNKPSWIGSTKPTYNLDEVSDGSTRKLSDYALKSEMNITPGTGNTTIQLKSGLSTTVLTQHQDISGKVDASSLATVATTGNYSDLNGRPTILLSDWNQSDMLKLDFIRNKPLWIGSSKPSYTLDEVTDGATRKLSDCVKKVKVGQSGTELAPDNNGVVTLPEYPTASSINITIGGTSYNLQTLLTNITNDITALKDLWQKTTDGGYTYLEPVTSTNRVRGYGFYDTTVS